MKLVYRRATFSGILNDPDHANGISTAEVQKSATRIRSQLRRTDGEGGICVDTYGSVVWIPFRIAAVRRAKRRILPIETISTPNEECPCHSESPFEQPVKK